MPEIAKYAPGMFCWLELTTNDRPAATRFYGSLFGWTADEMPMDGGEPYVMLKRGGRTAAALYQNKEIPPNWFSYIAVKSADDSARKAKDLGGIIKGDPFDVFDAGRMAVIEDPQGASFALWEAKRNTGIEVRDEANTLCWNELMTTDVDAARKFYGSLFDWKLEISPEYTEAHVGEKAVGGLMQIAPDMEGMAPLWQPYFAVDDCDATLQKAQSLGTKDYFGPHDIPTGGRLAVLADPQGAKFAVIKLTM